MPEASGAEPRASEKVDIGVGTDGTSVLTVRGNDSAIMLESDEEMPELDGTSDSDLDPFGDDRLSAISGGESDFDIDDLCGDHFEVFGGDSSDELGGSAAGLSVGSSSLNQTVEPCGGSEAAVFKRV